MFKNTFQSGFLSILYSIGSKPLQIWDKKVNREFHFGGKFFLFLKAVSWNFMFSGAKWTYKANNR